MDCREFEKLYWLRAYGELAPGGESGYQAHLEKCSRCRAREVELNRIRGLLDTRTAAVPKSDALVQARQRLNARLRAETQRPTGMPFDWLPWPRKRIWQPALALALILVGLLIGRIIYHSPRSELAAMQSLAEQDPEAIERYFLAENILSDGSQIEDLRIRPLEPESGLVQVSFLGVREYEIQGTPQDDLIRALLAWAVKNEENSGARLQSVAELAKASNLSSQAREALAYALINDKNDGVRLRALEALGSAPRDPITEQAILGALLKDANPAVRIGAIDALLKDKVETKSESFSLRLAESDSNNYVRMRARQAIRQSNFNYEMINHQR